jgi:hypothetical protein
MADQRLKPLRGEGAKLLQLVSAAVDLATLEQVLELSAAIGQPAEGLLDGIGVTAAGELLLTSRFRGTQATQAGLDLLLLHQLSLAADDTPQAHVRRAVRRLDLRCPLLPALRGFDSLEVLSVTLPPGAQWADLSAWGPMPALRTLLIASGGDKPRPARLQSLDGLHAPALEQATLRGLGLVSVDALIACVRLAQVDLSLNPQIVSIGALMSSAASLQQLQLEGCAVLEGIEPLSGALALASLNLKGCARVPSLQPLSSSRVLEVLDLEGCASLQSLQGLCGPNVRPASYSFFNLKGCSSLQSLQGLPPLHREVDSLYLQDMPALVSLEGIEAASGVTTLEIKGAALTHLNGLFALDKVKEVRAFDCKALEDVRALGQMPALARANVRGSPALKHLPAKWGEPLVALEVVEGSFTAIGQMPATLQKLEMRQIPSLHDLRGAETAIALKEVSVDPLLRDASAINGLIHAYLRCFNAPEIDVTSAWIQSTVRGLKPIRLDLRYTSFEDLEFLVELPDLEQLYVAQEDMEFYGLRSAACLTEAAVRTLQRAVCKKHQLPVPHYLKPRRASEQAVGVGGPSVADIKRGLTSTEFHQVVAALDTLRDCADPGLYDAVLDGVYPPTLYTGDNAPLGKMYRDIRAQYRTWARWAITHALMDAPAACASAQALCHAIETIVLDISLVQGRDLSKPLALDRFKSLKSFTLRGTNDSDLGFLSTLGPLESLSLRWLPKLTSLESLGSLASLPHLKALNLDRCVSLQSLKGLQGAVQLEKIAVSDCGALRDLTAMSGLPALTDFPGWSGRIDLSKFGALSDVGFLTGLASADSLSLNLQGRVDLSAFAHMPRLQSLDLDLDTLDQDFTPLAGLKELKVRLESSGVRSLSGQATACEFHAWQGDFLALETLTLHGGHHDLAQLRAPALKAFKGAPRLTSLRGVGHASTLEFRVGSCDSLDGLAGSPVTSLDLSSSYREGEQSPSLALVREVPGLQTVKIGPSLSEQHALELTGCAQVQHLRARGYAGSLAFLAGWSQLAEIDLINSGELTDLETLCGLPSLKFVRLRRSAMKRDTWPKALQDRLDFMSS